jgi:protein gp37
MSSGRYWDLGLKLVGGCEPVSPGCGNCWSAPETYIRAHQTNPIIRTRNEGLVERVEGHYRWTGQVRLNPDLLRHLLVRRRKQPFFISIWNDLFHPAVPFMFIGEVFALVEGNPTITVLACTKRPERAVEFSKWWRSQSGYPFPWPRNLWAGTTGENQELADKRVFHLLRIPAAVHFLSYEPALGPLDLARFLFHIGHGLLGGGCLDCECAPGCNHGKLNWVIAGGETGPHARPAGLEAMRSLRDQCAEAKVAFWLKGWGEWRDMLDPGIGQFRPVGAQEAEQRLAVVEGDAFLRVGRAKAGRLLDGVEHNGRPLA